jgi:putative phosphoesterase
MKIALISDIHANYPALKAVLDHIYQQGVDGIWNLGDFVGYGAEPDQVVRRLREAQVLSIRGNFGSQVLKFPRKKTKWRETKRPEVFLALQWAYENLTQPSKEYLESLPTDIRMRIGTTRILLTHGSPVSNKERLTANTPEKYLRSLALRAEAQIIICGHSHEPFIKKVRDAHFINPGSVGRQSDGHPEASYAILELNPELMLVDTNVVLDPVVRLFRIDYDLDTAVDEIRRRGLPESFAQILIQGRDLETVLSTPEKWQVPDLDEQSWWESPFKDQTRQEFEDEKIRQVLKIAEKESYNPEHVHQATFLALRLFDELQPLHRLGPNERFWLRCGSLLHDIGKGNKNHHLKALDMILKSKKLSFTPRERNIMGSIARYHRREGPNDKHKHFAALPVVDQRVVTILSSILRVADGLDASPSGNVNDLSCVYSRDEITIKCHVKDQAQKQKKRALGKGELMEFAFDRELYIEWHRI